MKYVEIVLQLAKQDPEYVEDLIQAWAYRVMLKWKNEEYDSAIEDTSNVIAIDPYDGYCLRGEVKERKGDYAGAAAEYTKAIGFATQLERANGLSRRADMWKLCGSLDKAVADYTKSIEIRPENPFGFTGRAETKLMKGDLDGAMADYRQALELNSTFLFALSGLARVYSLKQDKPRMLEYMQKALELCPGYRSSDVWEKNDFEPYRDDPDFKRLVGE
jgi:tetratricopeptide (TPR) repeat protein